MAYAVSATHTLDGNILDDLDVTGQTTDVGEVGKIVTSTDGRKYKKVVTDVLCVTSGAGEPAYAMPGTTANEFTSDYSAANDSSATGVAFVGLFTSVITATTTQYVWIEVPNGAVSADSAVADEVGICDGLVAVNDSVFSVAVSFSAQIVAVAMEAASGNLADIVMLP